MATLQLKVQYFQDSTPASVPCREENFVVREFVARTSPWPCTTTTVHSLPRDMVAADSGDEVPTELNSACLNCT